MNSIYSDIASVASVKGGASAPLFLAQKTTTTKGVNAGMAGTYRFLDIPSKKHNCRLALIL
jgi:hypothetical protein